MEINDAIVALGALAQETRLDVFRYLVAAGGTDVAAGRIEPVISATFPLSEARAAEAAMEERSLFGKVLIIP